MTDCGLGEFFLEALQVAAGFLYGVGHPPAWLTTAVRPQTIPIEAMIEMLGSIIEDRALTRFLDDFFETHLLELAALYQIVEVGDVSGVMFAVMELEGFFRNVRRERVDGIGQIRQFKGHRGLPSFCVEMRRRAGSCRRAQQPMPSRESGMRASCVQSNSNARLERLARLALQSAGLAPGRSVTIFLSSRTGQRKPRL